LSIIYLIRHGQAGARHAYDQLSPLGQQQAILLGQYFAQQDLRFDQVITGALQRQQHTAQLALGQTTQQMTHDITPQLDTRWNEFSLSEVYQGMLPLLLRDDETFVTDYAMMQETLRVEPHAVRGAVGRCDRAVIEAWMNARFDEYAGESWMTFRACVQGALPALIETAAEQTVAVFTSATPIALTVSSVLNLSNDKTLGLMAMLQNNSVTTLRVREGKAWLFGFNATPHLPDAALRTFR
jgi:broad specificity phosphatase PhoE